MELNLFNQTIAEVTISYSHKIKPANLFRITGSSDIYKAIRYDWPDIDYRESFAALLLSRALKVLGVCWISRGGVNGTVVDPKIIFQAALKANASSIALIHNHPSGTMKPSDPDIKITRKIKDGGIFLDITVVDHLIISSDEYYSFADEGIL